MKYLSQEDLQSIKDMIDKALQLGSLPPEVREAVKKQSKVMRLDNGEKINLTIRA